MNRLLYIKPCMVLAATAQFVAAYDYECRNSLEETLGNSGAMLYAHNSMLYVRNSMLHARKALLCKRNSLLHDYNDIGCKSYKCLYVL